MSVGRTLRTTVALAGGALVALLLVATLTGRPLVSYARSGSMEPTIGTLDVFFVDPWPASLAVGDIVVFRSVARGDATVHRIIDGDENGWYTQGDANPVTDQSAGEPLLTRDRVLGRVLVDAQGDPLLARGLGVPLVQLKVEWVKLSHKVGGEGNLKLGLLTFAASLLVLGGARHKLPPAPAALPSRRARALLQRAFPRGVLGRHLAASLALLALLSGAYGAMHADAPVDVQMVVVEDPAAGDGRRAAPPGGLIVRTVEAGSLGPIPTHAVLVPESERLVPAQEVLEVPPLARVPVSVEQRAGDLTGLQQDALHVWRYPALLPAEWTLALHRALPGSLYLVLGALLATAMFAWIGALRLLDVPVAAGLGAREAWR